MSLQRINISRVAAVAVLVAVCVLTASVAGQDDQKSNNRNSQSLSGSSSASFGAAGSSPNNDIYIDDEGLEGSGSRGEIRDDLEKEDDESSGSGYGDDDEDSSSISNSRSNSNSNVGILGGGGNQGQGQGGNNNQLGGGGGGQGGSVSTGTGKDGKSSSGGTSIKHSPDGDLEISQTQHITPTNGEGGAGGSGGTGHDSTNNNNNAYGGSGVLIMNAKNEDRTASFFAQPGILAAVIGGAVVGLLCAILVVMFIVYRMRKKDEGSYALDEPKRSPTANTYAKNANNREFYA
ncbi:syndecan isoform X2 [Culex pipiens pallens]|uniref:syndecan isoform X2 n=1 Tax=Culex pipiens pallens TaxID=42434 RepID=UPI001954B82F|nr:syndecan isoform X2 [Culex pipiens pallens]